MSSPATLEELRTMLVGLADDLEAVRIRVPAATAGSGEAARRSLIADLRHHLLARMAAPGAPLVVAAVGPSGVGVSTLVNRLAGVMVSPPGVLRPTTKAPVLWGPHGAAGRWWDEAQSRFGIDEPHQIVLGEPHTAGLQWTLVDIPAALGPGDALELAARADVCVFVNSAARYADAEAAALAVGLFERGVPTWFLLNKLPADPAVRFEITEAYAGLLHAWDLIESASPRLVETAAATPNGDIAEDDVAGLRAALDALADDATRQRVLEDAMAARLAAVSVRAEEVAEAIEDDRDHLLDLAARADRAYDEETDRVSADLAGGVFAALAGHSSWLEAAVDFSGILTRRAGLAAQRACAAWESGSAGRALLREGGSGLRRHGEHTAYETQGLLESWFDELADLAVAASGRRRSRRRRTKLAEALWPLVVDPDRDVAPRLRRWLASIEDVVGEARTKLKDLLGAALRRDAARFHTYLGPPPDVARLGRIITAASILGVAESASLDQGLEQEPPAADHGVDADAASLTTEADVILDVTDEAEPDPGTSVAGGAEAGVAAASGAVTGDGIATGSIVEADPFHLTDTSTSRPVTSDSGAQTAEGDSDA